MKPTNYDLGLAGEYLVCAELLMRGYKAQLTLGNAKAVDIILLDNKSHTYKTIEVKTSMHTSHVITNFAKYIDHNTGKLKTIHPDFWIFVQFTNQQGVLNPVFYIATHQEVNNLQFTRNNNIGASSWLNLFNKQRNANNGILKRGCDNITWKQLNQISPQGIYQFKDRWNKI